MACFSHSKIPVATSVSWNWLNWSWGMTSETRNLEWRLMALSSEWGAARVTTDGWWGRHSNLWSLFFKALMPVMHIVPALLYDMIFTRDSFHRWESLHQLCYLHLNQSVWLPSAYYIHFHSLFIPLCRHFGLHNIMLQREIFLHVTFTLGCYIPWINDTKRACCDGDKSTIISIENSLSLESMAMQGCYADPL